MPYFSILFTDSEYTTLCETPSILSELQPSFIKIYMTENGPSEKLDFSMPCCSILFTASEYTTLFEMPSILSELQLKIELFSVKVTIQRLNTAKLNRLIFSSTSKPSCCTPGPVASDLMIKAFPFDQANSAYQVASFHTI